LHRVGYITNRLGNDVHMDDIISITHIIHF
jgi:hypothetical protein